MAAGRKVSEIAIFTADLDATVSFYERVLGCAPDERTEETASFDVDGVTVFVHVTDVARREDHVAFSVPDLDAACDELRAQGVAVRGPDDFPWGRSAYMLDPDGREIELHSPDGVVATDASVEREGA